MNWILFNLKEGNETPDLPFYQLNLIDDIDLDQHQKLIDPSFNWSHKKKLSIDRSLIVHSIRKKINFQALIILFFAIASCICILCFSHWNLFFEKNFGGTLTSINICTLESAKQRTCFGQSWASLLDNASCFDFDPRKMKINIHYQ